MKYAEKGSFTEEQKEFLGIIQKCRRRMNAAQTWEKLSAAGIVGAGFALMFEAAAFVLPFYYANLYAFLAVAVGAFTGLVVAYRARVSEETAALRIDRFGFEERVITAYEAMIQGHGQNSQFFFLQQKDAMKKLREGRDRIKIAVFPSAKKAALCVGLLLAVIVLAFVPSAVKQRAQELHAIQKQVEEKQKEIEQVVEELEELPTEGLTQEQLAALQEMINSLQSSYAEYGQSSSAESLTAAGQKLDYKYADISRQLADMAKSLQNGAAASMPAATAMQQLSQEMQSLQQNAQANPGGGNGQSGEGQNGSDPNGANGTDGNQSGNSGDGGQGDGTGDDGQNGGAGQGGTPDGGGQNAGGGDGDGSGGNGNSSSGEGQSGDGNNGNTQGGAGGGRGTGSAHVNRDYISVPNDVGNDDSLTGQAVSSDNTEAFRAQNGLSWEGNHVSYESVIGEYQQKAYEGLSTGKYPYGMEDVIREYFGSFNE